MSRVNTQVIRQCKRCEKDFYVCHYRKDVVKYCSNDCKYNPKEKLICKQCEKIFYRSPSLNRIFCSHKCQLNYFMYIGHPNFRKTKGESTYNWKGERVGYRGLHRWVVRELGTPKTCEFCGEEGNGHSMHWANKSHKYKRVLNDWIRLCVKCHRNYDKERGMELLTI